MYSKRTVEAPRLWVVRWIEQLSLTKFLALVVVCSASTGVILSRLI
ncbi:hypothetical protein Brsp06_04243 [Brucella sp. NBRC 13694]|nr:hypothetical protein DR92_2024 [Brucella anthropi]MBA8862409.1 hypothetical protein [Brucella anthropi]NIH72839.1 hypothetical protein [Ochrobactrum sp. P20RRXII]